MTLQNFENPLEAKLWEELAPILELPSITQIPIPPIQFEQWIANAWHSWAEYYPATISIDTETSGVTYQDKAFCVTIDWGAGGHYLELGIDDDVIRQIIGDTETWAFHNAKFDLEKLIKANIITRSDINYHIIEDTEGLAHLQDENRSKRLKDLAISLLGYNDTITVQLKSDKSRTKEVSREKYAIERARKVLKLKPEDGYDKIPRWIIVPYAIKDAEHTFNLFRLLSSELPAETRKLYEVEKELTLVLLDAEEQGMGVNAEYFTKIGKEYRHSELELTHSIKQLAGKDDFNPLSYPQVRAALAERGIFPDNTQSDTLQAYDDPFIDLLLKFRASHKILGSYIDPILEEEEAGILHPHFGQYNTVTGRMSSKGDRDDS